MESCLHCVAVCAVVLLASFAHAQPPATKKGPVTDTYHGVPVTEDYRWLQDGKNKEVTAWSDAQNAHARSVLDKLPGADVLRQQITKILAAKTVSHFRLVQRGDTLFALKRQPPKQQPFLVALPGPDEPERARILVDPTAIDPKGTTTIDWYVPSPDGKLVAVSLSKGGSESGDVHVYETATGKQVFEVVPRVNGGTAGGDLAWTADGAGFFYTRYPRGKERAEADMDFFQQLYFHKLGTATETDRYELGKDLPRIAEIKLQADVSTDRLLATVQNGDSGQFAHFLRLSDGKWVQFSAFGDQIVQTIFGPKDDLYVVSRQYAPRGKMLRVKIADLLSGTGKPNKLLAGAPTILPEDKDAIVTDFYGAPTYLATSERLYVLYQLGGPSELRAFRLDGTRIDGPKQFAIAAVHEPVALKGNDILFSMGSFVQPAALYQFHATAKETKKTPLTSPPIVDFSDIEVSREFATSKDGTRVPVNILIPKGVKRDGKNPCLVTAYGGFGISIEPRANPLYRILFDHGFVVAIANLRGGSEFGEVWHQDGILTKRQNVYDDFAAVLQHMIGNRFTSPDHLAIMGGSNGGLLMGVAMTQHHEKVKAVIASVGIFDMLRNELTPNGSFNIPEYGTVKNADQFRALLAYSPYHNVKEGVKYPAALFLTGANDPRVDPMHSRKMTARLQAATASKAPILLRTSATSGHGLATALSERIEEQVDIYAFLFAQLGVPVRPREP